jgi:hypothetical protein
MGGREVKYTGILYGKVAGKYIPTEETSATVDARDTRIAELEAALEDEVTQLHAWANESLNGGWSTHQVDPMRKRASYLLSALHASKQRAKNALAKGTR